MVFTVVAVVTVRSTRLDRFRSTQTIAVGYTSEVCPGQILSKLTTGGRSTETTDK